MEDSLALIIRYFLNQSLVSLSVNVQKEPRALRVEIVASSVPGIDKAVLTSTIAQVCGYPVEDVYVSIKRCRGDKEEGL